jgi:MFS family permease
MAAALMTQGAMMHSPQTAIALLTGGMFGLEIAVGAFWAVCLGVGQDSAGSAAGMMSSLGNAGSAFSPIIVGAIAQYTGSWIFSFVIASALLLICAVLWLFLDPDLPLQTELESRKPRSELADERSLLELFP